MNGQEKAARLRRGIAVDGWLLAAVAAAVFLNGYGIWQEAYANTYYTTAVGSMLQSWHNFFYGSLDSAGSVTVDKPPLTFWIQAAFAWVFGLQGWSVILPQALASVATVPLLYACVKPTFGAVAARAAAWAMALTPVAVAVSRTNNIDGMLVFTLALAAWFLLRGVREGRAGNLLAAFALIGAGFNMKMLQAYMVLPAFYLLYVLGVRMKAKAKYGLLAGCTALMLLISVSWAVVVDAVPADKRPYVGSSETNSVLELAFGYNGISRLTGDRGGAGGQAGQGGFPGAISPDGTMQDATGQGGSSVFGQGAADGGGAGGNAAGRPGAAGGAGTDSGAERPEGGGAGRFAAGGFGSAEGRTFGDGGGRMGGGGGMFNTGEAGPLRLFQQSLSGQASWLLPLALLSALVLLFPLRLHSLTAAQKETLFWLAWLLPAAAFFSVAGFFHSYYLIMLAPPIAALAGAGAWTLWVRYREGAGWQSWLLPASIAATALFQWYILQAYESTIGLGWSIAVAGLGLLGALLLGATATAGRDRRSVRWIAAAGLAVLLIGPAYWSATPIVYGQNSMIPAAGPDSGMGGFGGAMSGRAAAGMAGGFPGGFPGEMPAAGGPGGAQGNGADDGAGGGWSGGAPGGGQSGGANPQAQGGMVGMMPGSFFGGGRGEAVSVDPGLLAYLRDNQTTDYLLAVSDYGTAAPYIVGEGEKVVILHGFQNSDPVYDEQKLEALVRSGKVKYFLVGGGGFGGGGRGGSNGGSGSDLNAWIAEHGKAVDPSAYGSSASGAATLYEVTLD
ncbi:glycosyltransferase family 39 protein [Paenibacillus sp. FSL W8-1187]|uniref:glycosyltransferase family 39 protein n=1 Tax=Paenibacillus sp. FSL W8-1187 TaxID=2975339 RepID=UPI0030DCF00A